MAMTQAFIKCQNDVLFSLYAGTSADFTVLMMRADTR
jgi:hypothetical protein